MAVKPPEFPLKDYRALARFRHLLRLFLGFSKGVATSAGLQPQQHQLLLAIKGLPPGMKPNVATLAWHLQLRHHSMVGLIDRLVKKGLVRRARGRKDRREVILSISAKGERILRVLSVLHREELRKSGPELLGALAEILEGRSPA